MTSTTGSATGPCWADWHARLEQRPEVGGSIPQLLERAADRFGDATALTAPDGTTTTYRQLAEQAARFGSALQARGVVKGDRVAVMLPNSMSYVVALFGALRAGAVVVQVNPIYVGRELEHMLTTTQATAIVVGAGALDTVRSVLPATSLTQVVTVDPEEALGDHEDAFEDLVASGDPGAPAVVLDPDVDLATIQFTGGTRAARRARC